MRERVGRDSVVVVDTILCLSGENAVIQGKWSENAKQFGGTN